jgi:hypothetical protein
LKLAKHSRKPSSIFIYLPRIGQCLAPYFLLSLSILSSSWLLGKHFFKLQPKAIALSLPLFSILIIGNIWWKNKVDKLVNFAYTHSLEPLNGTKNIYQILLVAEKYIYFVIYFLSDTISVFELLNLLVIGAFNTSILPLKTLAFLISTLYAAYIHHFCRLDDFNIQYEMLDKIMSNQTFQFPLQHAVITLATYACLWAALSASATPFFSAVLISAALCISLSYYRELFHIHYGIYLHFFAYARLKTFTVLLVQQVRLFYIYTSIPRVLYMVNYIFSTIALLYALVYYASQIRTAQIKELYDMPPAQADTPSTSWYSVLFSDTGTPQSPPTVSQ